ncbi:MAG: hypothetical protein FJW79_10120 [Actinobacteria bacterium]|nr:hypothetical protein [Actinomycetota bacterium]
MNAGGFGGPDVARIDLYWIPLGAGGNGYVRLNGRLYEVVKARLERRRPLDLYHAALVVQVSAGRYTVECGWPSPDADTASRGVVLEGPVFGRSLARFRPFRYEVRRWRDGVIPDLAQAVGGPQTVARDRAQAERLLDLVPRVPALIWGRDEHGAGEMWNSNSVISWLLVSAGHPAGDVRPPGGGRAPGWQAGVAVAGEGRRG